MTADEPLLDLAWIGGHLDDLAWRTIQHLGLSAIAVGAGFILAFLLVMLAWRFRPLLPPLIAAAGILYTIPSLALFAALVPFTGLSLLTAEIPLVLYTQLVLIRAIAAGLEATPGDVMEAAIAMGHTRGQRFLRISLPIGIPLMVAGLRLASVSTIGLVMVVTLIGNNFGGLGLFIKEGIASFFPTKVYVGAVLSVVLAVGVDQALAAVERRLAPWQRTGAASGPTPSSASNPASAVPHGLRPG